MLRSSVSDALTDKLLALGEEPQITLLAVPAQQTRSRDCMVLISSILDPTPTEYQDYIITNSK